jgi:TonB family protein
MSQLNSDLTLAFLFACSVKTTLVLAVAWMIVPALRGQSAALRHLVWTAAVLASLMIPFLTLLLPAWHSAALGHASEMLSRQHAVAPTTKVESLPAMLVEAGVSSPLVTSMTDLLLFIWAVGVLLFVLRLLAGLVRLKRTSAHAKSCSHKAWVSWASELAARRGLASRARLLQCADPLAMPLTWGIFRPQILVPAGAGEWSSECRRMVLAHELAHIARYDWLWQICAELMRAIYWFHPLAWIAAGNLRHESERACDDCVLNTGFSASDYADQLLALARTLGNSSPNWAAALAVARPCSLERRLIAVLNPSINRKGLPRATRLITAIAAMSLLLPLAALRLPAQKLSGKFEGTVHDPSGTAVRNATVIMNNANTTEMTTTNADGYFSFKSLPAGEYAVKVLKRGFEEYRAPQVVLEPGRESSLNLTLKVGAVMEEVDVVADGTVQPLPESETGGKPTRLRLGGDVEAPKLITKVQPAYPPTAKAAGVQGTVILHAIVGMDGKPLSLRVMNKDVDPDLARASVEAVSQWRYLPTLLNGEPIEVDTTVKVNFKLLD